MHGPPVAFEGGGCAKRQAQKTAEMSTLARKVGAPANHHPGLRACCPLSERSRPKRLLALALSQRLIRDFKRLRSDPPQGVNGSPNPDNIMLWNAVIFGPEDTPWDGGASHAKSPVSLPWWLR